MKKVIFVNWETFVAQAEVTARTFEAAKQSAQNLVFAAQARDLATMVDAMNEHAEVVKRQVDEFTKYNVMLEALLRITFTTTAPGIN